MMSSIASLTSATSGLSSLTGSSSTKKTSTLEDILAAQKAKEDQKTQESESAKTEFLNFAKMSPAERIRAAYLKEHNLTEKDLASMGSDEREKIEAEIKELIKTKLGLDKNQRTGHLANVTV